MGPRDTLLTHKFDLKYLADEKLFKQKRIALCHIIYITLAPHINQKI